MCSLFNLFDYFNKHDVKNNREVPTSNISASSTLKSIVSNLKDVASRIVQSDKRVTLAFNWAMS